MQDLLFSYPTGPTVQAHIKAGWKAALQDLEGPGTRYLISPFLTSDHASLLRIVKPGDKVVIRGLPKDFLSKVVSMGALRELEMRGAQIRTLKTLHAKLYSRAETHSSGVLWLGSANLTHRGENGTGYGGNLEAMSGPHALTPELVTELEMIWQAATPLDAAALQVDIDLLAEDRSVVHDLTHHLGVLAVKIRFQLLGGDYTIKPSWLGINSQQDHWPEVDFPKLPYVSSQNSLYKTIAADVRKVRESLKHNFLVEVKEAFSSMYVLHARHRPVLEQFLSDTENRMVQTYQHQFSEKLGELRRDFEKRFSDTYQEFARNRPTAARLEHVLPTALQDFDQFQYRKQIRLKYEFFIPLPDLSDESSELTRAVNRLLGQSKLF